MKRNKEALNSRRIAALDRLNAQLKSRVKTTKEGITPLSEKDINRINKEINTLKERTK